MTQFRKISNGFLIAPRRGEIPTPPDGYEVAVGDPFVFLPVLPNCDYRERRIIQRSCCGAMERVFCNKIHEFTTRTGCQECKNS